MQYRRAKIAGGTYFFTVVTYQRQKILAIPDNIALLRKAFQYTMKSHPFKIDAAVILPDHLHCLWTLPEHDYDFSTRWRLIKSFFTRNYPQKYQPPINKSRANKQERAVWQRRFWEHHIINQQDFNNHVDYIHYNPVKHGLVTTAKDWQYSSFSRYVGQGIYDISWGKEKEISFTPIIGME